MEPVKKHILAATLYVVLMVLVPLLDVPVMLVILMIGLPFMLTWLAVRILKDGTPTENSFEDQFYDDRKDLQRVPVRDESRETRD
ncbi:hypothetical protein [Sanyastnella coralliicola]|uniref:hypothetical protein n=1 Tax=Sanyastnella coralliicola TaxID=3069118 RepID=UPI0027B8EBE2|nr:hypothetical protein [Longitalea sp. SCSIO 12813]